MSERRKPPKRAFTIRQMEIDDLSEVYDLGLRVFTADRWPTLYRSWDEYEVTGMFNTDGEYCLVAENDDERSGIRICGFALGTVISKPGSAWSYGYVLWLCSHPRWRRAGVARKLVDKLVELMVKEEGIRIIMADTDPHNARAVRFFEELGLRDRRAHVYLSSNLETNARYAHLVQASREEAARARRRPQRPRLPKPKAGAAPATPVRRKPPA